MKMRENENESESESGESESESGESESESGESESESEKKVLLSHKIFWNATSVIPEQIQIATRIDVKSVCPWNF
jgi:hypothetical protein